HYLAHNVGNMISYQNISRELGLSSLSVRKYINALEKSYLVSLVPPFYRNKLKEIVKQHKLYFIDTGMRNAIANNFQIQQETKGAMFENYVFTELIKAGKDIRYWRSKGDAEVDFVVQEGSELIPIEVKIRADKRGAAGRSLNSFIASYKPKRALVVFLDGESGAVRRRGCTISVTNVPGMLTLLKRKESTVQ
ncbi:MAG: ATP-binding protein, partial [Rhabdochlamydiaceae bacterium]